MSEKQALILTALVGIAAIAAIMGGIKLLGGDQELMAIGGIVVMCVTAWETAGVVMRHGDKDKRR